MLRPNITVKKETKSSTFDGSFLSLDKYNDWVNRGSDFSFRPRPEVASQVAAASVVVEKAVENSTPVYGVTTGFGGMSNHSIDRQDAEQLQRNLIAFLATGAGPELDSCHTRGAMLLRASVLLQGRSGIRMDLIERLADLFQSGVVPIVRELGSIGASGDLVPLSAIARVVSGESDFARVRFGEEIVDAREARSRLGWSPIGLRPKEGLALVNGTSFSAAIAANSILASTDGLGLTMVIQAILMKSLCVDQAPFDAMVHKLKPHPGQIWAARTIQELIGNSIPSPKEDHHIQDRYSLRCFPQYIGPIVEGIAGIRKTIETEMNSVSDNPIVDPTSETFYQSGNFLGQYISIAMDQLRGHLGLLAKHIDVQIASLVAPEFNRGLPASLVGNPESRSNMGLKGLQICGNSIVPMLTHAANPLTEHFPTHAEQFNQNVNGLSWGAANLAWKSVKTFRSYLAISSLFAIQAIDLRTYKLLGHFDGREILDGTSNEFYNALCEALEVKPGPTAPLLANDGDRWLEQDIENVSNDLESSGVIMKAIQPVSDSLQDFFVDRQ